MFRADAVCTGTEGQIRGTSIRGRRRTTRPRRSALRGRTCANAAHDKRMHTLTLAHYPQHITRANVRYTCARAQEPTAARRIARTHARRRTRNTSVRAFYGAGTLPLSFAAVQQDAAAVRRLAGVSWVKAGLS